MTNLKSREIRLKSRPAGLPDDTNFEVATVTLPDPKEGEVLVHNLWMSVDPYMRGRMTDAPSYIAPFKLGEALQGGAIGRVVASHAAELKVGDYVSSMLGWREYFVASARGLEKIAPTGSAPIEAYLGPLGMPGLTAYAGLLKIGEAKTGDTVLVSGAAGAVGSVVCQIAKAKGCTVVGFAGSDAKCAWLRDAGVDHAINYKTAGDLSAAVQRAVPDGVDVYFENVGGAALVGALDNMKNGGRMAVCGMISRYNLAKPEPGPHNIINVLTRRLKMQGFIVAAYFDLMPQFRKEMLAWAAAGKMRWEQTVVHGVENAPQAFLGLFKGDNTGKMLVKVSDDDGGGAA